LAVQLSGKTHEDSDHTVVIAVIHWVPLTLMCKNLLSWWSCRCFCPPFGWH